LPALNALLNGLQRSRPAHRLHFIRARRIPAHRGGHDEAFGLFHALSGQLHPASRAARRRPLPGPRCPALYLPAAAGQHIILAVLALPLIWFTFFLLAHRPDFRSTASCPLGHFRCGCMSPSTGVITWAMLRLAQG